MIEKLHQLAAEYEELQGKLLDPTVASDYRDVARIRKRIAELEPLMVLLGEYEQCQRDVHAPKEVKDDPELLKIAEEEAEKAREKLPLLTENMRRFLFPRDPDDNKNVILEVRAGTGGEEAALFAGELLRMYVRYAERKGWNTEFLGLTPTENGGIKEAICRIVGDDVFGHLKFESGVHRVQRVPVTETKGRLHTSAASVAILSEAEEVDITVRPEDLRVDTFRAGGAGGQHVNKTDSAVRITHIPTGMVAECQSERSQHQNRQAAMQLLRSRLYMKEKERLAEERDRMRAGQIGTGDRSEKIRTYNFPQDRITDHRLKQNFSNLPVVLDGNLAPIIEALRAYEQEERMKHVDNTQNASP